MSALMASLAEHRRDSKILAGQVATQIGVSKAALSRWEHGHCAPRWPHVLAYAAAVSRQIVMWRDGILARGEDLPGALRALRKSDGLTQRQVAKRMQISAPSVCMSEARHTHTLATIEAYVTALGCELRHLPLEAP